MSQKIAQIGLFLPPTPGYLSDVLMGVREVARDRVWAVEVCPTLDIATASTSQWLPDGILVNGSDGDWGSLIRKLPTPVVQVGGQPIPGVRRVVTNNSAIGKMAAHHFLERGFRRFAFFGYASQSWSTERAAAFEEEIKSLGYECTMMLTPPNEIHTSNITGVIARYVRSLPKPIAVFACHDRAAMILGHACAFAGLKVPEQVAILGVDNNPVDCEFVAPPISSIMGSARRIGYQAAVILDAMMRKEEPPMEPVLVEPAGVAVRASTDVFATNDPDLLSALNFIRDRAGEPIEVRDVARAAVVTRRGLERKFRALLDRSPRQVILRAHIELAKSLLINTNMTMLDVALRSGFPSRSKFSAVFKRETTLSPIAFRRLYGAMGAMASGVRR